eukprot:442980-Pelagomonas_calceolata.AAC.1
MCSYTAYLEFFCLPALVIGLFLAPILPVDLLADALALNTSLSLFAAGRALSTYVAVLFFPLHLSYLMPCLPAFMGLCWHPSHLWACLQACLYSWHQRKLLAFTHPASTRPMLNLSVTFLPQRMSQRTGLHASHL